VKRGASTHPPADLELDELAATIDRDDEVPVGLQLGWALSARIQTGELAPGQRLPGLREVAQTSGLNVNTVRAVYQRLERQGLLESRQGSGTFVASAPRPPSAVGTIAAQAAREAAATGVSPREVAAALYMALPSETAAPGSRGAPGGAPDSNHEAARRRALRAQIATLERAIGEIETEHPGVAPRPHDSRLSPGPILLSAQELEQVRSALVQRLALVQAAIDEHAAATQAAARAEGKPRAAKRATAGKAVPAPRGWAGRTRALPT
jgi:DNA-binding transcriptional regulator YhcF (GntR family)